MLLKKNKNNYSSKNIKVLKGLEAVRKRPGMYIGDTYDGTGLHNMAFEIIDNSIDESLAGFCTNILVKIHKDNSLSVLDNGRGIPIDIHKEENISAAQLIMTVLHAGGKFDDSTYKISGGLHGVGVSVVNALSEKLKLKIYKYNKIYYQVYNYGKPKKDIFIIGKTKYNGTYIRFWPDKNIFLNSIKFKYKVLFKRLNELSFLNPRLNLTLIDKFFKKKYVLNNSGGLKSFLKYLIKNKSVINNKFFYFLIKKNNITLEVVSTWVNFSNENILCYTNNIPQIDGGTHLIGFKYAVTRTINNYINKEFFNKKTNFNITGRDVREGLYAIISIKFSNPKFSSQTKDKLISSEIKSFVENSVNTYLLNYLLENPIESRLIVNKIINSYKIREAARKARELSRKQSNLDLSLISNKLSDCQEKNPLFSELFLVEGDSAGGSAKQGRNRLYQAILPLKGKIINVEKTSLDKILSSKEINILISVLGCGIDNNNFDINKLRYHKIIIMTDADIDGAHIRTLLLTFFYKYMKDLILKGYLYIARPPLYKITKSNKNLYLNTNSDLLKYKVIFLFENINIYNINNMLLLNNKKLIKIILIYIKCLKYFNNFNDYLCNFILQKLIFFKLIDINDLNICNNWIIDFTNLVNINNLSIKINGKIVLKNKKFIGIKFYLINKFFNKKIFINNDFFVNNYYDFIKYSKYLFFFKNITNKYIIIGNKKFFFNNFFDLINFVLKNKKNKINIQRYKGLGEMNPDQLWNTTMNPNNRFLFKININDIEKTNLLFKVLMGDNIKSRKLFIKENI